MTICVWSEVQACLIEDFAVIDKFLFCWQMLIRRGSSKEGAFTHAPTGAFDRDLFALVWGADGGRFVIRFWQEPGWYHHTKGYYGIQVRMPHCYV